MKCLNCNFKNEDNSMFCSSCGTDLKIEAKSFWKHLFNWKYYIFPLFIGLLFGFDISQGGEDKIQNIKPIGFILGIIMATQFKGKILSKIGMFFLGGTVTNILTVITYILFIYVNSLFNNTQNLTVQKLLAQNKIFPKMISEEVQALKYTSDSSNNIKLHLKFINYSRSEILLNYENSRNNFERDMLDSELNTSCSSPEVKKMLSDGLVNWIEYYGKNNILIGEIYINNEKCKPYYN